MRIHEVMSRDVHVVGRHTSLREAARLMHEQDVGSLPVTEDERMVGMVTDRDIVVRAIAEGFSVQTPVAQVMSDPVKYCFDDEDVDDVARNMAELGVRRLPVVNRAKRLVGFVSLANIHSARDPQATEDLLDATAQPH